MSEATLKVTPIESKQPQPACRFSINAVLNGFPITIEGEGKAGDLRQIVDRLISIGAEPPSSSKPEPTKAPGAPVCPVHNAQMKASTAKAGTWFCSKKNDDGSYCRHKA